MSSLIVIGPSGVGKGTIIKHLLSRNPFFEFTLSFTTRQKREGEIHGRHYFFISYEQYLQKVANKEVLESKKVFNNYYGTSKESFYSIIDRKKIPVLDIDVEGMKDIVKNINSQISDRKVQTPLVLCVIPPSLQVLKERLQGRKTESEQIISKRLAENLTQIDSQHFLHNKLSVSTHSLWNLTMVKEQNHYLESIQMIYDVLYLMHYLDQSFMKNGSERFMKLPFKKVHSDCRIRIKNAVYLCLNLLCQFLNHFQSQKTVFKLLIIPGSNQSRACIRKFDDPCQSKVDQFTSQFICNRQEGPQTCEIFFGCKRVIKHFSDSLKRISFLFICKSSNRAFFQLLKVFSSEYSSSQWTPSDEAKLVVFEERLILNFYVLSDEQIIVVLSTYGLVPIEFFTNRKGIKDGLCFPVTSCPIECQTAFDHFVESSANLLERCSVVINMGIDNVDIVKLQTLQRFYHTLSNMFLVSVKC